MRPRLPTGGLRFAPAPSTYLLPERRNPAGGNRRPPDPSGACSACGFPRIAAGRLASGASRLARRQPPDARRYRRGPRGSSKALETRSGTRRVRLCRLRRLGRLSRTGRSPGAGFPLIAAGRLASGASRLAQRHPRGARRKRRNPRGSSKASETQSGTRRARLCRLRRLGRLCRNGRSRGRASPHRGRSSCVFRLVPGPTPIASRQTKTNRPAHGNRARAEAGSSRRATASGGTSACQDPSYQRLPPCHKDGFRPC